ncbi:MAG: DUF4139 domain-containing protein [Candidatus Krumholzibacteriia bacterium]
MNAQRIRQRGSGLALAILTATLPAGGLASPAAAAAVPASEPVISTAGDRQTIDVTVYNQDIGLVRELRTLRLPAGEFQLEFRDVPEQIQPTTLLVESEGRTALEILEQNYEYDLMSREKILEKYVGREIAWIQEDGERITGTLLGIAQGPVYRVGGEILFEVPGRMALPELPRELRARPTLVWRSRTDRAGEARVEASYLTGGMSWSADYVLQLDPDGREADLQAWVSLDNRSGATYRDARLLLVAGDVNRVRPPRALRAPQYAMEKALGEVADVVEEALYDYHLYTLPGTTTLRDRQIKQVSLFEATGIAVQRHYRVQAQQHWFRGSGGDPHQPVRVVYSFENREQAGLGRALPAGIVRVYGASSSGSRQLLGEDRIRHTPLDETVELHVGSAFDVVAERVQTDYRRVGDRVHRTSWEITLRNHKDEDVTVEVREQVGGDWEVLSASHEHRKTSATELVFKVPVPADGESRLAYTVQVTY